MIGLAHRGLSWVSMILEWYICTKPSSDDILSVDTTTSIYLRHVCTYVSSNRLYYPYQTRFIVRVCPLERDLTANARQANMRKIAHMLSRSLKQAIFILTSGIFD